jgi:hypothetical protein
MRVGFEVFCLLSHAYSCASFRAIASGHFTSEPSFCCTFWLLLLHLSHYFDRYPRQGSRSVPHLHGWSRSCRDLGRYRHRQSVRRLLLYRGHGFLIRP